MLTSLKIKHQTKQQKPYLALPGRAGPSLALPGRASPCLG